jgi:hypothetical protein
VSDFDDGYGDPNDTTFSAQDYADATAEGVQSYQDSQNQQFGMGSGNDSATGNAGNFTIGRDPNNLTNFIGPLSGINSVPNVFNLGGGVGDFAFGNNQSPYTTIGNKFTPGGAERVPTFLNPQLAEMYKQQEIARTGVDLNKNPYVDSIFTDLFGDSIDRTKDLGSRRVQEINDLRARQAFGLPSLTQKNRDGSPASYTSRDFEAGRDTNQGIVKQLPMGMAESLFRAYSPFGALMPTKAAPERSQIYKQAMIEENAPGIMSQAGDYISQMGDLFTGLFSQRPQVQDFDQFSPNRDNRQIEDFDQTGAGIPNFAGTSMQDFDQFPPTGSRTFISEATDPDFKGRTSSPINIEDISNPYEDNLGMTIKDNKFMDSSGQRFDRARPINEDTFDMLERQDRENNFQDQLNKLSQDQKNFLGGRTDTAPRGINEEVTNNVVSSNLPVQTQAMLNVLNKDPSKLEAFEYMSKRPDISSYQGAKQALDIYNKNTRGINEEELMAEVSPFSLLKGATGLYKGDINNYLQNNINPNLEFENDFRTIDDELQPYMGLKLGFSTA